MYDVFTIIILGIIQGLTEFLPVSSSGHLELAKAILGEDALPQDSFLITVVLHLGTACATIYVFWDMILELVKSVFAKDKAEDKKYVLQIIVSMLPAVVIGLLFEKQLEAFFGQNITLICIFLVLTGFLLFVADKAKNTTKGITMQSAILIGIAQAIAILPGISRSGATISTGVLLGTDRVKTASFSFLMVVPLIFGKVAKDITDGELATTGVPYSILAIGFLVSFIVGILACKLMISLVRKSQLRYFGYYCCIVGLLGIIYFQFINVN